MSVVKAVVVYESLWGNTAQIARAIAEGIGPDTRTVSTSEATAACADGIDLLVTGAPLLGFDLPTDAMRASIASNPGAGPTPPDVDHPSIRSWLEALGTTDAACATFETRIWWSPGSAAKKMLAMLQAKGLHRIAEPAKFIVTGRYGPLKAGETDRARAWGAELARGVDA
ncbi:MAG: hypothetical protein P4L93_04015 [Coriobacteriia bacterium]|nr:hypothetical protein [Coriobacteriia bacterium]